MWDVYEHFAVSVFHFQYETWVTYNRTAATVAAEQRKKKPEKVKRKYDEDDCSGGAGEGRREKSTVTQRESTIRISFYRSPIQMRIAATPRPLSASPLATFFFALFFARADSCAQHVVAHVK